MCPLSVSKHEVSLDKVSGYAAKSSFLSMYCIFASPNIALKLWGSAVCDPLGETKTNSWEDQLLWIHWTTGWPQKTPLWFLWFFWWSHTKGWALSAVHQFLTHSLRGSLDTHSPGDNIQEVIQPHKHLMIENIMRKPCQCNPWGSLRLQTAWGKAHLSPARYGML